MLKIAIESSDMRQVHLLEILDPATMFTRLLDVKVGFGC